MYLQIGPSVVVAYGDIVGLFDMDNTTQSHLTRSFLERGEREGRLESITEDLPKTFVVCGEPHRIYLSQFSTATLLKRAENNSFE